jgi:capsular exopolysaccharide synthesis family protein
MGEIADALKRARKEGRPLQTVPVPQQVRKEAHSEAVENALRNSGETVPQPHRSAPETDDLAARVINLDHVLPGIIDPDHSSIEICRHMAHKIRSQLEQRSARSVAIVSALRGEGKSTVSCNIAIASASMTRGRGVALVDLDLRKPTIAKKLGAAPEIGIEQVLLGNAKLEDVRISVDEPGLDVFPSAAPQRAAHELLVRPAFAQMVTELESRYSLVLFDTPPTVLVPDANLVLRNVSAFISVARAGKTRVRAFRNMVDMLPSSQALGTVLNEARAPRHGRDYYYYGAEPPNGA